MLRAVQNTQTRPSHGLRLVRRLIPHSPVASLPPRTLKLNPRLIPNYPYLYTLLMEADKDFNGGMHVPSRRKMMWVEEGRGEQKKKQVLLRMISTEWVV